MSTGVEETHDPIRLTARCLFCEQATVHEVYEEVEGDVIVLLVVCLACEELTVLEGPDDARAA